MQGFNDNNRTFVVKELGIVSEEEDDSRPLHYLFEPPCGFHELSATTRAGNLWLARNTHRLPWNTGDMSYGRLHAILDDALRDSVVFVKGSEKKLFLDERVECDVFDLSECDECPSLAKLRSAAIPHIRCPVNHDSSYCAYQTCQILKGWYRSQKWSIEEFL